MTERVDGTVPIVGWRDGGNAAAVTSWKQPHAAVVQKEIVRARLAAGRYVPSQVADRLGSDGAMTQQELEVTVLCLSDIRGFSTIAEQLSAREIADVVGKHLSAMAEVVTQHGGTIDKFQGDAVMAVFGAPEPLLDHAERALRCAIEIQARQAGLNVEGWGSDAVDQLGVGIGLNTGLVIAGAIGGGGRLEYTVIGDAVNIAQRLQSEAAGGEIVAGWPATVAAAREAKAEPIGPRRIKGREGSVDVYRIVC